MKQNKISNDIIQTNNIVDVNFEKRQSPEVHRQNIKWSGNDEYYTPLYAIEPILKYLKPNSTIWCPFDLPESWYVKKLTEEGHNVIATHINTGQDFLTTPVPKCDYIISNPPYSIKVAVFKRLFEIGIPFMMLVGTMGMFDSQEKYKLFKDKEIEIMHFSHRVGTFRDYSNQKCTIPPFSSAYLCSKVLPKQIVFEDIKRV